MDGVRRWCGVFDVRCGNNAERLALRTMQKLREIFDPWTEEGIGDMRGEDPFLVIVLMVAGYIATHSWGRVCHDAVERISRDQSQARKFINRQVIIRCAPRHAVANDASRRAVGYPESITEHNDDVLDRRNKNRLWGSCEWIGCKWSDIDDLKF